MFNKRKTFLSAALFFLTCSICTAAQVFVSGVGNESTKEGAIQKAKVVAWKNYLAKLEGAKLDNILSNEQILLTDLDSIISDVNLVDMQCSPVTCEARIKATINESVIDSKLRQVSKSSKGVSSQSGNDEIALLVMARMAEVQTSYDARVTKRAEATATVKREVGEVSGATAATSATVGGSSQQKRDSITWVAYPNINDLQNRIGEALTTNRISTIAWEELVSNCKVPNNSKFSTDFATSATGELSPQVRSDIFKKLKECQLNKLIVASIEVDSYRVDPNTGLILASGNINIQAFDISGRFAKSIGAANRTFSGRGEKQPDAARNALGNASKDAADVVVNQFNLK